MNLMDNYAATIANRGKKRYGFTEKKDTNYALATTTYELKL